MAQRVIGGAFSAAGSQRAENEDAFGLPPAGAPQSRYGTLIALADGVGSRPNGAVASRAAVYFLQALYYAPFGPREPGVRLRHCFEIVNSLNRLALKTNGLPGQGLPLTTLVAAVAFNDRLWIANVGDSRAYHARGRDGQLHRLTEDHSQLLTAAEGGPAGGPPTQALTHAIGLADQCQVDVYSYTWEVGDRLILASDGLRGLPEADLARLALTGSPTAIARALVNEALARDDSDNVTAVVAAWEARPAARAAPAASVRPARTRPALGVMAVAAGLAGLLLGWLTAAVVFVLLGGLELLR